MSIFSEGSGNEVYACWTQIERRAAIRLCFLGTPSHQPDLVVSNEEKLSEMVIKPEVGDAAHSGHGAVWSSDS